MSVPVVRLVRSTLEHARHIGANLCREDLEEVILQSGMKGVDATVFSFEATELSGGPCITVMADDEPVLIAGVSKAGFLSADGQIWMLQTDIPKQYGLMFGKYSLIVFRRLANACQCRRISNTTHKRNLAARHWIEWLGFTIDSEDGDWLHFHKEL